MCADSYTEVTQQSWFSRIADSIKGILFGGFLFLVAFPILFWNEGRAVKTAKTINEGAKSAIAVAAASVNPANEGKLVYLTGHAESKAAVADPVFGVKADASIKLVRTVEMYQWKESSESKTEKNLGGSTTTEKTYTYKKEWAPSLVASADFKQAAEHTNPAAMPYAATTVASDVVTVGAFSLSPSQVGRLTAKEVLPVTALTVLPKPLQAKFKLDGQRLYQGADPANPQVGDVRVSFAVLRATDVSVISQQIGASFTPYIAKTGNTFDVLREGTYSLAALIEQEKSSNSTLTWILRGLGLFLLFLGLRMILAPLEVLMDVVPFLGDLLGAGLTLIALLVAAAVGTVTIAVAWIVYRPLLGVVLLLVAGGLVYLIKTQMAKKKAAAPEAAAVGVT
jgi:Transmembrane protein 43